MGLADKLITRIEQQAQALDSYRQLDDQRRARIYELEGELVKAVAERNVATEERSHALIDVSQKKLELQDAIAEGELMQAEIDKLRKWKEAVQVILDRIEQLSDVSIGDAEACIESVHQIRKYFDPNEYPVLKGGE